MKFKFHDVRLAFPHLFEGEPNEQGKLQFSCGAIFSHDHPELAQLHAAIDEVGKAKWGAKWPALKKQMGAGDNLLIHDGDAKASLEGYEGNLYLNAYNIVRPTVVDRDTTPLVAADGRPYSGCYVDLVLDLWAQDNKFGKKINAQLQGVQFRRDGDAFAGGGKAADAGDFEEITEGADAGELV